MTAPRRVREIVAAFALVIASSATTAAIQAVASPPATPDFGPNVHIFSPSMDEATIQQELDSIATAQVGNQFGSRRDAVLFEPGTYGSSQHPLNFQVGYYTTVAGLGQSPSDVVIDGSVFARNQCDAGGCTALDNFWRSLSNLTINVDTPGFGCYSGEFWPVSQASPMRRVHVNGFATLMDYCTGPSFASGGFIADSAFDGSVIVNGSQQQWFTRNSRIDGWTNAVWNQVFMGDTGAPSQSFPNPPFTVLATSPVTREAPYLYVDGAGGYRVFVPAVQHDTTGPSWASGPTAGTSMPIDRFFVASPSDSFATINAALHRGQSLILTPGVYNLGGPLEVTQPDTVILGLGMPTLIPQHGAPAMNIHPDQGVLVSGVIFDAGPQGGESLLDVGSGHQPTSAGTAADPSGLYDVFFRIGGAAAGKVGTALVVNSNDAILDDVWAWRADHGNGVGWTVNTADTGVVVNGDNVSAYGFFVEHFQKHEVLWNGNNGTDVFFQNEMPYDVPSQAAWMEAPGVDGYAAFKVADNVSSFHGYGMGSYSFFNQGVDIFATNAFEAPATLAPGSIRDLLTIFLDASHGKGGILHVISGAGGSSTIANPDVPVTVVSYP